MAVEDARDQIADCSGPISGEVVFTAGGTEADNLAVAGGWEAGGGHSGTAGRPGVRGHGAPCGAEQLPGRGPADRRRTA